MSEWLSKLAETLLFHSSFLEQTATVARISPKSFIFCLTIWITLQIGQSSPEHWCSLSSTSKQTEKALEQQTGRKEIYRQSLVEFFAFWAYSVKRRRIKINFKSHWIRYGLYVIHCVFVGKMNQRTAFATLKMNMFMTMTFSLGTLIYKSIIYRRLVLCKKTFFRKSVQIAVHSRLIHLKLVFLQKIRKFGCRKNSFKASFNEGRNEFRCLSVIRFLQHGCILCTIDKIVKRNEFIFLPRLSFST